MSQVILVGEGFCFSSGYNKTSRDDRSETFFGLVSTAVRYVLREQCVDSL